LDDNAGTTTESCARVVDGFDGIGNLGWLKVKERKPRWGFDSVIPHNTLKTPHEPRDQEAFCHNG
jgi:hypothetical protein